MDRAKSIGITETLTRLLPYRELEALAKESGMPCRRRKVNPPSILWTLVLGFGAENERKLAGLRQMYVRTKGTSPVPSAFYDAARLRENDDIAGSGEDLLHHGARLSRRVTFDVRRWLRRHTAPRKRLGSTFTSHNSIKAPAPRLIVTANLFECEK